MNKPVIDLRSDTVTQPTPAMRQAIAQAPVGDDVLGDDPTVLELEQKVAALMGKEAAVYMPSGTMTNQVALRVHTEPGDEIILEAEAHIYYYEGGGPAALSGASCQLVHGQRGIFSAKDIQYHLRHHDPHYPKTRLVCLENTHNRGGGAIFPLDMIHDIANLCKDRGLALHLDGARLWNACVATGINESEYAAPFDTVSVCFSKGLGAPVGSALVGSAVHIERARRFRKLFGGGMRQAGVIAAGALYALENHRMRLREDHDNAQQLAQALAKMDGIELDPTTVQTNIVAFVTHSSATWVVQQLKKHGIAMLATGPNTVRAVTSLAVTAEQIEQTITALQLIVKDSVSVA